MKIIFFGTPPIAAHILGYLIKHGHAPKAIVTRPDKPKGRSAKPQPSAVKALAQEKAPHIPVYQPPKASAPEFIDQLKKHKPDLFVVIAYGEIIKQELLDLPRLDPINIHPSLLPKYRGSSPIEYAILNGDAKTGVTIMEMIKQLDAGPIIDTISTPIDENMTGGQLYSKLTDFAGPLLLRVIEKYEKGTIEKILQDDTQATYCSKITPEFCRITWDSEVQKIHNHIRALSPRPGAWTKLGDRRLKILATKIALPLNGRPGQILTHIPGRLFVACRVGAIEVLQLQPEGKKPMKSEEFLCRNLKNTCFQ